MKKEAESVMAEDTSEKPEIEEIEGFRLKMLYDAHKVTQILRILEESRPMVERTTGRRMMLLGIALNLSKETNVKELQQLREAVQKANEEKDKKKKRNI
ncbi:hypothetical protein R1flu_008711 [Riccia fluitans]|uniref:Uncharacterized protein n=1 Tax=Riccia fluitans TaxID=41844 RepID=A0ABD1YCS2_9MARC